MQHHWFYNQDDEPIALFIPHDFSGTGHNFLTPPTMLFQIGVNSYRTGAVIDPHRHNAVERRIDSTMEFIVVRTGKVRITLLDDAARVMDALELVAGDSILFVAGGHGLTFIEAGELLEVKQGPYVSREQDKTSLHCTTSGDSKG